jgi:hypothetical protein
MEIFSQRICLKKVGGYEFYIAFLFRQNNFFLKIGLDFSMSM